MPRLVCAVALAGFVLLGCDPQKEPDLDIKKSKSIYDVKQSTKSEMSEEELKEARKKAGFKSHEERLEEAKAQYDKMERGYIKGRLSSYREMVKGIRGKLDTVEKAAPKWASKGEAAFTKFNEKYKEDVKAFKKSLNELTENGNRGGNLQVEIGSLVSQWDAFNGDLDPKISEADGFATTLEGLRKKIGEIEKELDTIEKDDTIEADEPPEKAKGGKKDKKKKK